MIIYCNFGIVSLASVKSFLAFALAVFAFGSCLDAFRVACVVRLYGSFESGWLTDKTDWVYPDMAGEAGWAFCSVSKSSLWLAAFFIWLAQS